jgi:F-type H+-transporting ATPase subunit a
MLGFFKYAGKYVNLKSPVGFAVGIIELISNLGRLISFSFRLFGNIFAGEVMILVASFFLPYLLPVPLMAFEMFVGLIQAIVFAMLTLFFIKLAIAEPHGSH